MSEPQFVEEADPDEVFTALSDGNRVAILQALWDAEDNEATFSELRVAVGMRDSGQFNYHLDRLVGRLVRKTDEGYELTQAGVHLNGSIEAGAYTKTASLEPITLDDPCPTCGGTRQFRYEDEVVRVECESCPVGNQFGMPPAAFAGYDREELPEVASRYLRSMLRHIDEGFCSFCDGRMEPTVASVDDVVDPGKDESDPLATSPTSVPLIQYECQRCGARPTSGVRLALLTHPAVAAFYDDRGVNIQAEPIWEFAAVDTDLERVVDRDPFRARATYEADGDSLTLVVDADLAVVDIESD